MANLGETLGYANTAARRAAFLQRDIVDQHETETLDPLGDIASSRRGDRSRDEFAIAVERAVAVGRHYITGPS